MAATLVREVDGESPRSKAEGSLRPVPAVLFWLLAIFFLLEYARPPVISEFKFQWLFIALFPLVWLADSGRRWSVNLTLQAAFVAASALTVSFASNGFWAYMQTRAGYSHLVLALAITRILGSWSNFVRLTWFWVGIMAYQALYGITHVGRGTGGFIGDENDLALGCSAAIAFPLLGLRCFSGWRRMVCAGLVVLFAVAVVVSWSRGGFLALAATTLYCVWTGRNRLRNLALGAVCVLVFFAVIPGNYKAELLTIKDTRSGTADARQFLWTAGFNMWKDNPVLGVGAGNSSWRVGQYQPRGGRWDHPSYTERDWTMMVLHSLYFQVLAELGLVGVILFGAIIVGHFGTLRAVRLRTRRDPTLSPAGRAEAELYCVGLAGAMVSYLAAGIFLSVLTYPYPWYLSAMAVAFSLALPQRLAIHREAQRTFVAGRDIQPARGPELLGTSS